MTRRLATVAVLIFLRDTPFFQCQFLMIFSTVTLIYTAVAKPLREGNAIECFNEFCIMLCSHVTNVFLNIAVSMDTRDALGWVLMGIALLNIVTNLVIIGSETVMQIIRNRRVSKRAKQIDEINKKKLANRA